MTLSPQQRRTTALAMPPNTDARRSSFAISGRRIVNGCGRRSPLAALGDNDAAGGGRITASGLFFFPARCQARLGIHPIQQSLRRFRNGEPIPSLRVVASVGRCVRHARNMTEALTDGETAETT